MRARALPAVAGVVIMSCCGLCTPAYSLGLIYNGGFELPAAVGHVETYASGSTAVAGWTILYGSIDIVLDQYWQPYSGRQSLDLEGLTHGGIEQAFATTPGTTYWLSFAYANNIDGPRPPGAGVLISGRGGSTLLSSHITHAGSTRTAMNYALFLESFVADDTMSRLRFDSTSLDPAFGIALDAVGVYDSPILPVEGPEVPEPSSLLLLGLGVASIAAAAKRRDPRKHGPRRP